MPKVFNCFNKREGGHGKGEVCLDWYLKGQEITEWPGDWQIWSIILGADPNTLSNDLFPADEELVLETEAQ